MTGTTTHRRMTESERREWLGGTRQHQENVGAAVRGGSYQCDDCAAPAVAIGYGGSPIRVRVKCPSCFARYYE